MSISRRQFLQLTAAGATTSGLGSYRDTLAVAAEPRPDLQDSRWRSRRLTQKPNIVIAVLDDVGFADLGCYGSELATPCIDALASSGTRFNNFHVTALCSPTRACLLTGRNAHAVGVGNIAEWGRAEHPGYKGWIRQDAKTLAEILRAEGYSTLATGKWHLSSLDDQNGSGPFDHWPVSRGFDRWYGFHGSAVDHWHPEMFENTSAAYPDKSDDYHLTEDLVDRSIHYVSDHIAATPERPFFLYLALGAMHFPLHAPADEIRRHRGAYDDGWHRLREQRFQRQKTMHLVPPDTTLPARNPDVPEWEQMSDAERRVAARGQEIYAGFLEHTDTQLNRLVTFLRQNGQFDNTIMLVLSDNGAAAGGPAYGRFDVRRAAYLGEEPIEELVANLDAMGGEFSYPAYARGWAQAGNTPLKWYKADTYEGGIRAPMIISWPDGDLPGGQILSQYHHVIDVVPSLLNMINAPDAAGVQQDDSLPLQGTSFAYALDAPEAKTRKSVQYFETLGDRAIWSHGWKAVARHVPGSPFDDDRWELFHAAEDFSEVHDLAAAHPDKLDELKALWRTEAERYDVLPLEDDTLSLYQNAVPAPRATYVLYPGMTRLDRLSAPDIYQFDTKFVAEVAISTGTTSGVIIASGDSSCGYEWLLRDGYPEFVYIFTRNEVSRLRSTTGVSDDSTRLGITVRRQSGTSATVSLSIDDITVAEMLIPRLWPIYAANSGLRCGENRHAPVSHSYAPPFSLGDSLQRVVVDVDIAAR